MTKAELLKKMKELKVEVTPEIIEQLKSANIEDETELSLESLEAIAGGGIIEDVLKQMKKFL